MILDPGHEAGTDWTEGGPAGFATRQGATVRSGAFAYDLTAREGFPPTGSGNISQNRGPLVNGTTYRLSVWVKSDALANSELRLELDDGQGLFVEVDAIDAPTGGGWVKLQHEFLYVAGDVRVRARMVGTVGGIFVEHAFIDDWALEEVGDVKTTEIREAIVRDFERISVANGFQTNLAGVVLGDVDVSLMAVPGIKLTLASGGDGAEETWDTTLCDQTWDVVLVVLDEDQPAAIEKFLDDARNAVEGRSPEAQVRAVAGLKDVKFQPWSAPEATMAGSIQKLIVRATITVTYGYHVGGL